MTNIKAYLNEKAEVVNKALEKYFSGIKNCPDNLLEAMKYGTLSGGKRIRAILAMAAAEAVGKKGESVIKIACAAELIHNFSLIHDDLPCMDNDLTRRGKPTCHAKYGETLALLAGDALLIYAFEIALPESSNKLKDYLHFPLALRELAAASGPIGMVGGQVLDIEFSEKEKNISNLLHIHSMKTGALIRGSILAGAIAAGANKNELECLSEYGSNLGLTFQIVDDILDYNEGKKDKISFPAILGLEKSRQKALEATRKAFRAIEPLGEKGKILKEIANYLLEREI
ncbi:MAG: polyprenyl synthetase family protein [Firmicutes bacterium]|nr:polyprenyl synthetase family protein [Bacillota bacterium]